MQTGQATQPCPCGRLGANGKSLTLSQCCGPYLAGAPAPDAHALMRSRYSAFVLGDEKYLMQSWHPRTRPREVKPEPGTKWLGLEVRSHKQLDAINAEVEFVARYRVAGRAVRLHERSRFLKEESRWYYLDGDIL